MSSFSHRFLSLFDVLQQVKTAGSGTSGEAQTEFSRSAGSLWSIIRDGDLTALEELLASAPDGGRSLLETRGPVGELPLHLCFLYNTPAHKQVGRFIMSKFPDLISDCYSGTEYTGENILHIAIINGDEELVEELIALEPRLIYARATGAFFSRNRPCYYGEYPIFFAACTNQFSIVLLLLNAGADLNVVDSHGNTILHLLVLHSMMEMYEKVKKEWLLRYRPENPAGLKAEKEEEKEIPAGKTQESENAENGEETEEPLFAIERALSPIPDTPAAAAAAEAEADASAAATPAVAAFTGLKRFKNKINSAAFKEAAKIALETAEKAEKAGKIYFEYIPASASIEPWRRLNQEKLTPVTLAAQAGKFDVFSYLLEENKQTQWIYGSVSCFLYPLEQIDTPIENSTEESSEAHHRTNEKSPPHHLIGPGALELILQNAHLDLLMHPRILDLIQKKWEKFASKIFFQRFCAVFIYLIFFSYWIFQRHHKNESIHNSGLFEEFPRFSLELYDHLDHGWEIMEKYPISRFFMEFLVYFTVFYKAGRELQEILQNGLMEYIFGTSGSAALENLLSITHVSCVFAASIARYSQSPWEMNFLALAVLAGWFYLFFFFMAFRFTGPLLVMLRKILFSDVARFLSIFSIFCMGFSSVFFILTPYYGFSGFLFSLRDLFLASIGKFNFSSYMERSDFPMISISFLLIFILFVPILLLNLLIAMMGDTYGNINERSEQEWHLERARIIFSIERELSRPEREQESYRYWTNIDGKRFLQVLVADHEYFPRKQREDEEMMIKQQEIEEKKEKDNITSRRESMKKKDNDMMMNNSLPSSIEKSVRKPDIPAMDSLELFEIESEEEKSYSSTPVSAPSAAGGNSNGAANASLAQRLLKNSMGKKWIKQKSNSQEG